MSVTKAPASTPLSAIPVLDLADARDPVRAAKFSADLLAAARDVGFFALRGHGLTPEQGAELVALGRALFALPEADKEAIAMLRSPHFRGWTRLGGELTQGRTDWRQQIDIGPEEIPQPATSDEPWNILRGPNQWPEALPELRPAIAAWQATLGATGSELIRQFALALGQAEDIFDAAFEPEPSTLLKIIHYPGAEAVASLGGGTEGAPNDRGQGVGAHKDPGFLTLLYIEPGKAGLEVQHQGSWISVPPIPGALVVNLGEILEVATNGLLKATVHRVVSPPPGEDRVSIPYFHNPALSAHVPPLHLPPELAAQAPGVTQDAHNTIHDSYGANVLKARLRAHPDVAAAHHADLVQGVPLPH